MPKKNSKNNNDKNINNGINNTNKNNGRENIKHDRISKQGKKHSTNHNNTKNSRLNRDRNRTNNYTNNTETIRIDHIEVTDEVLTDRYGILLFTKYLLEINIYPLIKKYFGGMRKSKKGISMDELFKQLFCYFLAGTSLRLIRFDEIKEVKGMQRQ